MAKPSPISLVRIHDLSSSRLKPLMEESIAEGFHFLARLERDWHSDKNRFDTLGEVLLLAGIDCIHVGVCGLNIDPYGSVPTVGRLRYLYVAVVHRRAGVGRMLVEALVAEAAKAFRKLTLRTDTDVADSFYRALGFIRLVNDRVATHELDLSQKFMC